MKIYSNSQLKIFLSLTLFGTILKKKHYTCINAKIDIYTKYRNLRGKKRKNMIMSILMQMYEPNNINIYNFNSTEIYFTLYHFSKIWKETCDNCNLKNGYIKPD